MVLLPSILLWLLAAQRLHTYIMRQFFGEDGAPSRLDYFAAWIPVLIVTSVLVFLPVYTLMSVLMP